MLAACELPGMSGVELAEDLRAHRRDLPVILMSASTDGLATAHIRGFPFIRKPFTPAAITHVIEKALSSEQHDQPLKTESAGD
jgi:FixJ family two-component response regulator